MLGTRYRTGSVGVLGGGGGIVGDCTGAGDVAVARIGAGAEAGCSDGGGGCDAIDCRSRSREGPSDGIEGTAGIGGKGTSMVDWWCAGITKFAGVSYMNNVTSPFMQTVSI